MPDAASRATTWVRLMPVVFVLIWSTGFIVARFGMPHAPPITFLSMRYALSLLLFGAWIAWSRPSWPLSRVQWGHLAVTGILLQAGYLTGVWAAVKAGIGAGTVALLVGLQPVLTAVWLSATAGRGAARRVGPAEPVMADRESPAAHSGAVVAVRRAPAAARVSTTQWIGLALGLAGLTLVVWRKLGVGELTALNLSLALGALLSITIGTLYQKRHVAPCDVRTANAVQLMAALLVSLPLTLLEAESIDWQPAFIGAMLWSAAALTLGGSSLYYLLVQKGAATQVTSLMYLVPPCTATLAWLLFGEELSALMLGGMLITAAGVALVARPPRIQRLAPAGKMAGS